MKTRKLLKTLTALPKGGISLQTKIIKIYTTEPKDAKSDFDKPLGHGDSRDVKFEFMGQKEYTFVREMLRKSGFRKIRLGEGRLSLITPSNFLKNLKLLVEKPKVEPAAVEKRVD